MFPSDSNSWTWHGPLFFPSWIHFGAFNSQPTNLTPRGQKYLVIPIAMQSNVHFCLFAQDFIVGKFIYCVVCRVNKQTRPYITCYIFYIINVFRSFNMLKLWFYHTPRKSSYSRAKMRHLHILLSLLFKKTIVSCRYHSLLYLISCSPLTVIYFYFIYCIFNFCFNLVFLKTV